MSHENQRIYVEYYQPILTKLMHAVSESPHRPEYPHSKRGSFWNLVPPSAYTSDQARPLLLKYIDSLEKEFESVLSQHSITYYLHLYRRIAPEAVGPNRDPSTVNATRAILEAAIQKFARPSLCGRIAFSADVKPEEVLKGELMKPKFGFIRKMLVSSPQLVLTDFGLEEAIEFGRLERLAYEVWRTMAMLRVVGKGAGMVVDHRARELFYDNRSAELATLVDRFDSRLGQRFVTSATGTVFRHVGGQNAIPLPTYNVERIAASKIELFKKFDLEFDDQYGEFIPNFVWSSFDIAGYWQAHQPFADEFEKHHGIRLQSVIAVLCALSMRMLVRWLQDNTAFLRSSQRAYDNPISIEDLQLEIRDMLPHISQPFGVSHDLTDEELSRTLGVLSLGTTQRTKIDLGLGGPHAVLLPCPPDAVLVDHVWLHRRLYHLFYGIKLEDQNFKAAMLESFVQSFADSSPLPSRQCKAADGTSKQIDAAFAMNNILAVVECKAPGMSIAVDRGDPVALQHRLMKVHEGLNDADDKAQWLSKRPVGRNYNVSGFEKILPVVVTPFTEFMPSLDSKYWISDKLPRVLTPDELRQALISGMLNQAAGAWPGLVSILKSS